MRTTLSSRLFGEQFQRGRAITGDPSMPFEETDDSTDSGPVELGLRPLAADEWGDEEYAAYGSLLRMPSDRVPRFGSGHAYDPERFSVVGTFVRHPRTGRGVLGIQRLSAATEFAPTAVARTGDPARRPPSAVRLRVGPARQDRPRGRHHRRRDRSARAGQRRASTAPTASSSRRPTNCSVTDGSATTCCRGSRPNSTRTR